MAHPAGKKYELIVFDFDGTLVDTVGDIAYHANTVLADYGYPKKSVARVQKAIGWGVHELLKLLAPGFEKDAEKLEAAVNLFKKRYKQKPVLKTDAFPGVRAALEGPLKKTKKAIVTNKPQDITELILKKLKLSRHFELTIGLHAGFLPKPDPGAMRRVMKILKTSPGNTIFIGDSVVDRRTSKNAKIDFGWVRYGYDDFAAHKKPAIQFRHAGEWEKLV